MLERVASGQSNRRISAELGLVEQTVRNYSTNIYSKLRYAFARRGGGVG